MASLARLLVLGAGPGGLYTALLTKRRNPAIDVVVVERNRPDDTFGWGVVLSDQTVDNLQRADPDSGFRVANALHHWDDIDVHFRGHTVRSSGHGFSGIGRQTLLALLQQRCTQLGVRLQFECDVDDVEALARKHRADMVVAADGINSRTRARWSDSFQPDTDVRLCRFVWLGTPRRFESFTFAFEETEFGWAQAHAYRFDEAMSTFIVEMPEPVWIAHGLDKLDTAEAIAWCERVFAKYLEGQPLLSNATHKIGSAQWIRFPRITCKTWTHWLQFEHARVPVVLLGDAAHTAHFSIGSGTKLALEDAIELDAALAESDDDLQHALGRYQTLRSVEVLKLQNAARNSTEWFEHVDRYATLDVQQFAYSLLTRSQRISHEGLRTRDPEYIAAFERWFAAHNNATLPENGKAVSPMFTPFTVRGLTLSNRVVVSAMAQYSALDDGTPSDWHFVHLGARAAGGAGLVMTEMTCVAPDGRISPWCTGLWNETHLREWTRIVRFAHDFTPAKIGLQLGHAGAKGATKRMWEGNDVPLETGEWPLIAPSEMQYLENVSQTARSMTRDDMNRVRDQFVYATELGVRAGFDWLELHCAHGYLLSAFLSPLTNRRTDEYGGSVEHRVRFPLEVFRAMRAVWPVHKPMSVRISAHDWTPDGNTADDAVLIARAFRDAGADMMDVSAGQVVKHEQPVFGRMWQTPFADRIRQEAGIPTIAVGAITDADQLNSILASGRADLVAVGRPHLTNPAWTLTESTRLGYDGAQWPLQYLSGKSQLERLVARAQAKAQAANNANGTPKPGELT
ncbi:MAG: bifunctional salicylyl-CoA 5-hydroxylase/oxidoreductase [Gemmatimonadaceae bacterium]